MKKVIACAVAALLLAGSVQASEYGAFSRDLVQPYDHFKKSLSLTSKKEDADKAKSAIAAFIETWGPFAAKYSNDVPTAFAGMRDFSAKIMRPLDVGRQALEQLKDGNVQKAHSTLEEIRYLMWDMRVTSSIVSLSDKANDFHEVMEIVLDRTAEAKDPDDARKIYNRYGGWLLIKWNEMANAPDATSVKKDFDQAFESGRKSVAAYLDALKQGNPDLAKKLSGDVKGGYKKVWMLNSH